MQIEDLQFKVVSDLALLPVNLKVMMELTGVLLVVLKTLIRILILFQKLHLAQTRIFYISTTMATTQLS